jgi:hypothetical protein
MIWYLNAGGVCSLCESPGTNKSTCPLNPNSLNPNPSKHPNAEQQSSLPKKASPKKSLVKIYDMSSHDSSWVE